jgi:hypothetical protein
MSRAPIRSRTANKASPLSAYRLAAQRREADRRATARLLRRGGDRLNKRTADKKMRHGASAVSTSLSARRNSALESDRQPDSQSPPVCGVEPWDGRRGARGRDTASGVAFGVLREGGAPGGGSGVHFAPNLAVGNIGTTATERTSSQRLAAGERAENLKFQRHVARVTRARPSMVGSKHRISRRSRANTC